VGPRAGLNGCGIVFKYALENRISEIKEVGKKNELKGETEGIKIDWETSASRVLATFIYWVK
jgi:hypothetical protein